MGFLKGIFGKEEMEGDSLLFFFLLLIIIFCQCEFFEDMDSLLFFFLLLVVIFCNFCGREEVCN